MDLAPPPPLKILTSAFYLFFHSFFFSKIDKRTPTFIFPQSLADQTKGIVSNPTQKKIVHILLTYVEYHLRNREIQMWQMVFERIRENDIFNGFRCKIKSFLHLSYIPIKMTTSI